MEEYKRSDYVIDVDGHQVFTVRYVFEQMGHQSCRIDRIEAMAAAALVFSIISLIAVLVG